MKYANRNYLIPTVHRHQINENILMLIGSGEMQEVTAEEIYNTYTGIGGLHDLDFKDYNNRHEFTEAKKVVEQGQFFTPAWLAEKMGSFIDLKPTEFIADLTAGSGIFCNHFPESNFYGCEIESKAHAVAKFLYPDCRIELQDLRFYNPDIRFDFIIGNPPFNLKWEVNNVPYTSQEFYFEKAAQLLRPAGLIMAIVPKSYCADATFNRSDIEGLNAEYNFLCQVELSEDSFKLLGVAKFATKVMFLQKKSESIEERTYTTEFCTWEQAASIFTIHKEIARKSKIKANSEITSEIAEFEYKLKKYLYEIRIHKVLMPDYPTAIEFVEKYRNQKCPNNMEYAKWYNHHRITPNKVLAKMKRIIAKQNRVSIEKTALVKTTYGLKIKAYSKKENAKLKTYPRTSWTFNELIIDGSAGKHLPHLPAGYKNLLQRKIAAYKRQDQTFNEVVPPANISAFMEGFIFMSKGKTCHFNEIQRTDISKEASKDYAILNWQQGGGKTGAGYAWSKYNERKTFIVSSSLSINITWTKFLKENNQIFINVKTMADLDWINAADYVIISHGYMIKYERQLKAAVKQMGYKVSLILDESDEITNHLSKRTRACKSVFQKASKKLLTTGTTTRNNIAELYTQLELLYNNSINFLCTAEYRFVEDKDKTISKESNTHYGQPFRPYFGNNLFRQCFNPSKSTVFGIRQQNQNIYNEPALRRLIEKTIITRKFKEIAGDKYTVTNQAVNQSATERHVYHEILKETHTIISEYYTSTGNSRKDASLRMIRQIQLLIKATSMPQSFSQYEGTGMPGKPLSILERIASCNEKTTIGCITLEALEYYKAQVASRFPDRPIFIVQGDVNFKKRGNVIDLFQASKNGVLICTQQSLKSSVNIPGCKKVFIESSQWNIPTMEQFYFRFIRYDSIGVTEVVFFSYHNTIEANLLALLMAKEKLNDYIKTLEYRDDDSMYQEYGLDTNLLDMLITKEKDENGALRLSWGKQLITE